MKHLTISKYWGFCLLVVLIWLSTQYLSGTLTYKPKLNILFNHDSNKDSETQNGNEQMQNFNTDKYSVYDCSQKQETLGSLPTFMVIGVHKGGSTALYDYLAKHGHVRPAICKETNYFTNTLNEKQVDMEEYRTYFLDNSKTPWVVTGEATPNYIRLPHVPPLVAKNLPHIKIILSVRDPVQRFVSHFVGFRKRKKTTLNCSEFLQENIQQLQDCVGTDKENNLAACKESLNSLALVRSMYGDQIARWLKVLPKQQIFVIQAERLFQDTPQVMQEVASFLDIRPYSLDELKTFQHANRGSDHSSTKLSARCNKRAIAKALGEEVNNNFKPLMKTYFPSIFENWKEWYTDNI